MAALENSSVAAGLAGFAQYLLDKGRIAPEELTLDYCHALLNRIQLPPRSAAA